MKMFGNEAEIAKRKEKKYWKVIKEKNENCQIKM